MFPYGAERFRVRRIGSGLPAVIQRECFRGPAPETGMGRKQVPVSLMTQLQAQVHIEQRTPVRFIKPAAIFESGPADRHTFCGDSRHILHNSQLAEITSARPVSLETGTADQPLFAQSQDQSAMAYLAVIKDTFAAHCANLFLPGRACREFAKDTLDEAFYWFGYDIALAHGKDIRPGKGISFCATGLGIVDFPHALRLLKQYGFEGDMVLHGIYEDGLFPGCVDFMRKIL